MAEYGHQGYRCSITGWYVYRGPAISALQGTYIFGDYCSGEVFGLEPGQAGPEQTLREPKVLLSTGRRIASFGEDEEGELYVVGHRGSIHKVISSWKPVMNRSHNFPAAR